MSVDVESKDVGGVFLHVFNSSGEFDTSGFTATTGVHLGFDHDGCAESFCSVHRFLDGEGNFAV